METLKKIVTNHYFPAAAVLTAVVLFWTIAMFGGLSMLNNNQPPMATLTWMLFVYAAAVLTPLAGVLAAMDLVRRWRRNRMYALAMQDGTAEDEAAEYEALQEEVLEEQQVQEPALETPAQPAEPEAPRQSAPKQPAQHRPATQQQPLKHQEQQQPARAQTPQSKQRKTAA